MHFDVMKGVACILLFSREVQMGRAITLVLMIIGLVPMSMAQSPYVNDLIISGPAGAASGRLADAGPKHRAA
jgi:hypothetical protein